MPDNQERRRFMNIATLFEGGLALLAAGLGWLLGIDPFAAFHVTPEAFSQGTIAAGPMLVFFWLSMRYPVGSLKSIRTFLMEYFAPYLALCRWYELLALATLAGLGEELLFRGVLQPWMSGPGVLFGLVCSNLVFGLLHAVTPTYAVLAAVMGMYLGWLSIAGENPNLLVPITTHAVYDWLAFWYIARKSRESPPQDRPPAGP